MTGSEIIIDKVEVQFLEPDNIEHEEVLRLLSRKIGTIGMELFKNSKTPETTDEEEIKEKVEESLFDLDINKIDIPKVLNELLDNKDFAFVRDALLKSVLVTGVGTLNNRQKINSMIGKYGIHFMYLVMWEAGKIYLGKHLNMFLASGSIPESVKQMLRGFSVPLKNILLSSQL